MQQNSGQTVGATRLSLDAADGCVHVSSRALCLSRYVCLVALGGRLWLSVSNWERHGLWDRICLGQSSGQIIWTPTVVRRHQLLFGGTLWSMCYAFMLSVAYVPVFNLCRVDILSLCYVRLLICVSVGSRRSRELAAPRLDFDSPMTSSAGEILFVLPEHSLKRNAAICKFD